VHLSSDKLDVTNYDTWTLDIQSWPLHLRDVKNVFLNGDLLEEILWSNLQVLLLRGSLLDWYVVSA